MSPKPAKKSHAADTQTGAASVRGTHCRRPPDFCDYGVGIIGQRLDKLLAHTEGAKSGERHQRHSSDARLVAPFPRRPGCVRHLLCRQNIAEYADFEREVKNVTRALGAARDLDVMMETLRDLADSLPAEQRGGVESLETHLQAQRADLQKAVTQGRPASGRPQFETRAEPSGRKTGVYSRHSGRHATCSRRQARKTQCE